MSIKRHSDTFLLREPLLEFANGQTMEYVRDGLHFFGPFEKGAASSIRVGVVGTSSGIDIFNAWVERASQPVPGDGKSRPTFPGFEATFGVRIQCNIQDQLVVSQRDLEVTLGNTDRFQRSFQAVELLTNPIVTHISEEDLSPDLWFIVVPELVSRHCRPEAYALSSTRHAPEVRLHEAKARRILRGEESSDSFLFPDLQQDSDDRVEREITVAKAYDYAPDFHDQLKIRLMGIAVSQVVQEKTLRPGPQWSLNGLNTDQLTKLELAELREVNDISWSLNTSLYYKACGRPWRIHGVRSGVCYLGLVFKQAPREESPDYACCAAQLHIDSGDGMVFRGALGPWHTGNRQFHLNKSAAYTIAERAITMYKGRVGNIPEELFIHGRARFNDDEWSGFHLAGQRHGTRIVGIRVRKESQFKLFTDHRYPPLRGTFIQRTKRESLLWTVGTIPRLGYALGVGQPRPLSVSIVRGDADLQQVAEDILALTKVNYNACVFADGLPVTVRFADAIGSILTAAPRRTESPQLPFKWYI